MSLPAGRLRLSLGPPLLATEDANKKRGGGGGGRAGVSVVAWGVGRGGEFGVSNNVRRIDPERSDCRGSGLAERRSLFLCRSGGTGPNSGACHPAQIN